MSANVYDGVAPEHGAQKTTTVLPSAAAVDHTELIAAINQMLERRKATTPAECQAEQDQLSAADAATQRTLERATAIAAASGDQAREKLAVLGHAAAAFQDELMLAWTRIDWLQRRAISGAIWLYLIGTPGAGKSTLVCSGTGIPDIVPSWKGDAVSGATVRIIHTPGVTKPRATLALANRRVQNAQGDEIKKWIAQRDREGHELDRHKSVTDAEMQVEFKNSLAQHITFVDGAGVSEGQVDEEHRRLDVVDHQADVVLILDRPDDYRRSVTPINRRAYDLMARDLCFVVINRTPFNGENCQLHRNKLIGDGIPEERIFTADCTNTSEVNEHVIVPAFEAVLKLERQRRNA